jgi:hypothetical protein
VSLNIRSYATGNAVDTKVVQSSWNLDKLDGTGASGLTLNLSRAQILVIDFQWLGVGRVRIGFDIDGILVYVHEFLHANETSVVYMSSGNQPIRYELTHNGTGESSSLEVICATAISEGGLEKLGVSGGQIIDVGSVTGNTAIAAFGIKLSDVWNAVVKITSVEVLGTTVNDFFGWALFEDPTVAGTFTYAAPADSAVLFAAGDNTNTVNTVGLRPLKSGLGASQSTLSIPFDDDIQLSSSVNGTAIPLVLVVYPFSNMSMYVALNWRELA